MQEEHTEIQDWERDTQKLAVLGWVSFLVSCITSVLFFAFIDPLVLVDAINVSFIDGREMGYTIGFFFFWCSSLITGWLCLRLARRKRQKPRPIG